jgi:hypothetical protein
MSNGESLRQICRDDSMPCTGTVLNWKRNKPEFLLRYNSARADLLEHWAEEITEISDDGSNDWMARERDSGRIDTVVDADHVSRSRLRVESRKWLLSKLAPQRYGEALKLSGDSENPLQHVHKIELVSM